MVGALALIGAGAVGVGQVLLSQTAAAQISDGDGEEPPTDLNLVPAGISVICHLLPSRFSPQTQRAHGKWCSLRLVFMSVVC